MSFDRAARIADAVLFEGYVLYPYRVTSTKNRFRWTFGVVAPQSWSEAGGCEAWWLEAQLLVCGKAPRLAGRVRFLSVVDRRVEQHVGGVFRATDELDVDGRSFFSWEEGELREVDFDASATGVTPFTVAAKEEIEILRDAAGCVRGRVVRTQAELRGVVHVRIESVDTPPAHDPLFRLSIRVENVSPGAVPETPRGEVMRTSIVSAHVLVAAAGSSARFISLFDPPPQARAVASTCTSVRCWPVLAGEEGRDDLVLASPIILYDHPQIAPESTGDFFDACEIDEILALRTRTLTPEEKAIARATDPRAAAVVDRADAMTDAELARLHGARRDRTTFVPGSRVRLRLDRPGKMRRSDAQDLIYSGRSATVRAVRKDVDGRDFLAVTIDDDPAAELLLARGVFHYYYPDEVEPLDAASSRTS